MSVSQEKKKKSGESQKDKDVEMKEKDSQSAEKDKEEKKDPDLVTLQDLKEHVQLIEKGVSQKEARFVARVLRSLATTRRRLNSNVLRAMITGCHTASSTDKEALLRYFNDAMEVGDGLRFTLRSGKASSLPLLPEVSTYLHLLCIIFLIDQEKIAQAKECSDALMVKISALNRRTLDLLAAKCYFYHSRAYELSGGQLDRIRGFLHSRLRTATLHSDYEGQATLVNLLLRNYISYDLYDQADKLVTKSTFPVSASNNEWARYLYYLGRIKAIQLDYSEAHKHLLQALRKAPQQAAASGFRQTVQKLATTVELLLGNIPERAVFRQPAYAVSLAPYFQLTQAVRNGNLSNFNGVLSRYGERFRQDNTYTLIIRLRHNVIKTGVRKINLSYSCISLVDVAQKLQLDSPEEAEYILAKAIRDKVIEASIDHERGYVQSKEKSDVYVTREPMTAFHDRISFCLDIHNNSVKAMRFPPKSYNKDLETPEERREREQQEMESAKEIADEDFDGFP